MRVDVLYFHPDGTADRDRHTAADATINTRGRTAVVKLRDKRGRVVESYHYSRYSRIRIVRRPP